MSAPALARTALDVDNLTVEIRTPSGTVRAVDGVSFSAKRGRTLALLGESGCGKSMTAQALVGLLEPIADVVDGTVMLGDTDLVTVQAPPSEMQALIQAVDFKAGQRYLVAANDGFVTACAMSAAYSDVLAALYAEAYGA